MAVARAAEFGGVDHPVTRSSDPVGGPRKRVHVGDVLEVTTARGFAYVQVSHQHPMYGDLIRVLPGVHKERPELSALTQQPHLWLTFFPAKAAVSRGIVRIVGTYPVASGATAFPLFRIGGLPDPKTHAIGRWSRWNGVESRPIERMREEEWALPPLETINDTLLIERILSDWRPQHDAEMESRLQVGGQVARGASFEPLAARHFLHFPDEQHARDAAATLATTGRVTEVVRAEDRDDWRVVVTTPSADLADTRRELEQLADGAGGTYDGWETRVGPPSAPARN